MDRARLLCDSSRARAIEALLGEELDGCVEDPLRSRKGLTLAMFGDMLMKSLGRGDPSRGLLIFSARASQGLRARTRLALRFLHTSSQVFI